ncbi:MAG: hypothetical protein LH613_12110 [Chamaesiphon sp.]|nr:hypothetical protein [Chamaesiphon sp.]
MPISSLSFDTYNSSGDRSKGFSQEWRSILTTLAAAIQSIDTIESEPLDDGIGRIYVKIGK